MADFDGDGNLDLVASSASGPELTVLLGNGDGSFRSGTNYGGLYPGGFLTVSDINGDGIADVALVTGSKSCGSRTTVDILLGNGDGSFQLPVSSCAGAGSYQVAAGDLNGDSTMDLVTADFNQGFGTDVTVLVGHGDGTFEAPMSYSAGFGPESVAIADFNSDNRLDVIVNATSFGTGYVAILAGAGDGTLGAPVTYGVGVFDGPSIATADMNGDGNLDVVGAGGGISVLLGEGDGTFFAIPSSYPTASTPTSLAIADLNNDGLLDIAEPNSATNNAGVLLNLGSSPVATLSTDGIRFGGVKVGTTSAPVEVKLTNQGYSALAISNLSITGDFLEKNDCEGSVAIQATCTITVQFRPRSLGSKTGKVTITDNAKPPAQVIHLRGAGIQ
jgi:hypothetical protein